MNVVVTDNGGKVITIPVNTNGNFQYSGAVAAPFHVKIVNGAKERAMGGTLTASSTLGAGSTFTLTLPRPAAAPSIQDLPQTDVAVASA